jgi:hypothetical protein
MDRRLGGDTIPSMNDGRPAVQGRESNRMQATGLKTTQGAYNRDFLGILLTGVVLAAVIAALVIATSGKSSQAAPAAGPAVPAANVYDITPSRVQFLAEERSVSLPAAATGRVLPIGDERTLSAPASAAATGRVLPIGDERNLGATGTSSAPKAVINPRHMIGK